MFAVDGRDAGGRCKCALVVGKPRARRGRCGTTPSAAHRLKYSCSWLAKCSSKYAMLRSDRVAFSSSSKVSSIVPSDGAVGRFGIAPVLSGVLAVLGPAAVVGFELGMDQHSLFSVVVIAQRSARGIRISCVLLIVKQRRIVWHASFSHWYAQKTNSRARIGVFFGSRTRPAKNKKKTN